MAGTRFLSENKPVATADLCEVLAELGKGYDYNRKYRNEPLAGIFWGNEGFYNFVLRVVHVVTGFDNPAEREKYFENVLLQSRFDSDVPY